VFFAAYSKKILAPIGRARNALPLGNGAERRNPGKRDKMPSVAFYPASFLAKTCLFLLPTNDAPSMALLVLRDKMLRSLTGHGVPGTVPPAICSRRIGKLQKMKFLKAPNNKKIL
ncbi:MAG: hypothetical protein II077_07025, partial [Treponema sp.]|nr:hypothetical protein [Treponema sp.]